MAKFSKAVNIWNMTPAQIAKLQPGQWVTAGDRQDAARGQFLGQGKASDVVAWKDGKRRKPGYIRALRNYAKGLIHKAIGQE